jgi:ArsR family transcriptional regulator
MNVDATTRRALTMVEPALECCRPLDSSLSGEEAEANASLFKALSDPARVRIVSLLACNEGAACVCDLTPALGLSQPTVSHHLKKLVQAGLLLREQRGVWAYYSLDRDAVSRVASLLEIGGGK